MTVKALSGTAPASPVGKATRTGTIAVVTTRFGRAEQVAVPTADLYTFPDALPGLPEQHRYVLLSDPDYLPLGWLQALDEPACCLPVVVAGMVALPEYDVALARAGVATPGALPLLVTRFDHAAELFVTNALAPIVLDTECGVGRQVVLDDARYAVRQPICWDVDQNRFGLC